MTLGVARVEPVHPPRAVLAQHAAEPPTPSPHAAAVGDARRVARASRGRPKTSRSFSSAASSAARRHRVPPVARVAAVAGAAREEEADRAARVGRAAAARVRPASAAAQQRVVAGSRLGSRRSPDAALVVPRCCSRRPRPAGGRPRAAGGRPASPSRSSRGTSSHTPPASATPDDEQNSGAVWIHKGTQVVDTPHRLGEPASGQPDGSNTWRRSRRCSRTP